MYSVSCRRLSTACPSRLGTLRSDSLSSDFFENISSGGAVFEPAQEGFESERFIQFRAGRRLEFGRSGLRIRKKTVSRTLALSTAIFVVSGHRKDERKARRLSQKGGSDGTRCYCREGRSCAFRNEWDDLQVRQRVCSGFTPEADSVCHAASVRRDAVGVPVKAKHGAGQATERVFAT